MCGIIGIIGKHQVAPLLLDALKRLEYRGYDSAGLASLLDGKIERRRASGKLHNLVDAEKKNPLPGTTGIGHTRWATHGAPSESNAHPHSTSRVAVVHNGIIENFSELRAELESLGQKFTSDTDTEVVVHLLDHYLAQGLDPVQAVAKSLPRLQGAFALAMIFAGHDTLIGARKGSPLVVGYGDGEMYLGSDALAVAPLTDRISYLEEGDWAVLSRDTVQIYGVDNGKVERKIVQSAVSGAMIGKGNHRHFMHKEIYEQPAVLGDTLHAHLHPQSRTLHLPQMPTPWDKVKRLHIVACGTSYHSGMIAKYWFEHLARIPVDLDIASEFRYRDPVLQDGGMGIFISQSGETADTLAALRLMKQQGFASLAVVNVPSSSMAREADAMIPTLAGPEIGVASTKAFTTQLMVLAALAVNAALSRGTIDNKKAQELILHLTEAPALASKILDLDERMREVAHDIYEARDVLYLGRGPSYPVALEGALKLKELSYIHAEGYAAGEMKHGPIALIDENMPIVAIAPYDKYFEKTASNLHEVLARGGKLIVLTCAKGRKHLNMPSVPVVELPEFDHFIAPILYSIPIQLLAYHAACLKGTDVDQPRNLAKSVTVE